MSYDQTSNTGENISAVKIDNRYKWAGGGFIASARDVVEFAAAHLQAGYLKESTLQELFQTQFTTDGKPINYGLARRPSEGKKGRQWIRHSGRSVGART